MREHKCLCSSCAHVYVSISACVAAVLMCVQCVCVWVCSSLGVCNFKRLVSMHVFKHKLTHTHAHTHAHKRVLALMQKHTHTHAHIHICTHTHTHHTHTHTCTHSSRSPLVPLASNSAALALLQAQQTQDCAGWLELHIAQVCILFRVMHQIALGG